MLLYSVLPSSVAYWGQGSVAVHRLSGEPLRRTSKTNHQWEVKLLQCHSDNPQWCRHTSSAKLCGWILTRTKMAPNSWAGVRVSRHGWTSWINHTSMTESVWSQKAWRSEQGGFCTSFILADCWPHGWGSWALRNAGCCARNTELCIWEGRGDWLLAPIPPPPLLPLFPFTDRQMRESRWSFTGGQICGHRIDRHCGACSSFPCFLHHFTELGEMPLSTLSSNWGWGGQLRKVLSLLAMMYASYHTPDTFGPLKSARGGYELCWIDCQGWRPFPALPAMSHGVRRSPL